MQPYFEQAGVSIFHGDCRDVLRALPDASVQTCVTSPPYFGLRDYGVDGQIGLEETPQAFVDQLVSVFREVRRVLADDGTLWLNLGDSYAGSGRGAASTTGIGDSAKEAAVSKQAGESRIPRGSTLPAGFHEDARLSGAIGRAWVPPPAGLKNKDLIGIPWMVAFALRADGWYLRQDVIWHKPNPMPESVEDRCTKSHEYIFLLSKSERYFYDREAIAEPVTRGDAGSTFTTGKTAEHLMGRSESEESRLKRSGNTTRKPASARGVPVDTDGKTAGAVAGSIPWEGSTRNKRSVWTVTTKPFTDAHFATFPPDLIEPCIKAGSRPGDLVLDPFHGSGTTGEVSQKWGRRYVGIELNAAYIEMSKRRFRQGDLFAAGAT